MTRELLIINSDASILVFFVHLVLFFFFNMQHVQNIFKKIMISYILFFGQDRLAAFQLLATMYIKYIQIFRKMEQCYDQIVHPQKRRVLRHVLDGTMGRILELKHEMVNLEFSEYHYFDDVLSDLKLTPVRIVTTCIYITLNIFHRNVHVHITCTCTIPLF